MPYYLCLKNPLLGGGIYARCRVCPIRVYFCIMKRAILCLSLILTTPAIALDGLLVGLGASALGGINVSLGYHNPDFESYWARRLGVRIDFATTDPLKSAIDSAIDSYMRDGRDVGDGVKIDEGSLDAWHGSLVLDYYPFAGAWRLSGGYAWGGATLDAAIFGEVEHASAQRFYFYLAGDHYYYNGNNFNGTARIDWNYHGPYFGTGFDFNIGCRFGLTLDFGAVLTNRPAMLTLNIPQEQLYVYNMQTTTWSPVSIPQLDTDVARATRDANDKLSDLRVYPMVKLGFSYRF